MKKRHPHKDNVLLVNITRLGDMLQATPTIAGMKRENPNCKVTVLVEKQFEAVCHTIPHIDEVRSLDLGMTVRSLAREQEGIIDAYEYLGEVVNELRNEKFDYCLNMSSSAYTALLLKLVGIGRNGGWTADEEGNRVIESSWAQLFASSVFHQNRQFNSLNLVDVFRCSADVDNHPRHLPINVAPEASDYARNLIAEAGFTAKGPLIAIQAGASQQKRQWAPAYFIKLVKHLTERYDARVVLLGTEKERPIIDPIEQHAASKNVVSFAGRTSVPQLAAVLKECKVLVTGDTGTMHMSVAVGTPTIAMFLASAYGFETGPYSEGNIVLQPVIGCGPCNPNKPCAKPDCHDLIDPALIATLAGMRAKEDFVSLPDGLADPRKVIVYRSTFDAHGFCDLKALNSDENDAWRNYRNAYRKVWLDDLAALPPEVPAGSALQVVPNAIEGLDSVVSLAREGSRSIDDLCRVVRDLSMPAQRLGEVSKRLADIDRQIEQTGYHVPPLGPLTRMFCFAKENIQGTDAIELASQMRGVYQDLARRGEKLGSYYAMQ